MHLVSVRVVGLGPLGDLTASFGDDLTPPRRFSVVLGGGGVGKTSLLGAIASTRPGYAVAFPRSKPGAAPFAITRWRLGQDEPSRPHPLRVASPTAQLEAPEDTLALRREQALYEKRAAEGGHVLVLFPASRWFSRTPSLLSSPERTIARYDVRAAPHLDDATRGDLARETKQALCYAHVASALARPLHDHPARGRLLDLDEAMREVVSSLTSLGGFRFVGADPLTLEPAFASASGETILFDDLPTSARNLAAFGALTLRALFAAYPDVPPRRAEGVVLIDEIDLHLEPSIAQRVAPVMRQLLPGVQWVVTTSSPLFASGCEADELLTLRRASPSERVELHEGHQARVH